MMAHDIVFQQMRSEGGRSELYWFIYCRKCGWVAYHGNWSNESIHAVQSLVPFPCIETDPAALNEPKESGQVEP